MKRYVSRFTLALALAACVLPATAQTTTGVKGLWIDKVDAMPPCMGIDMIKDGSNLYMMGQFGTTVGDGGTGWAKEYTDTTCSVYFNDTFIGKGAPYEGASYNNNLIITKLDTDGQLQWTVYSTSADVYSNEGGIRAMPDGGTIVAVKLRHTDNMRTQPISLTDATGAVTTVDWKLSSEDESRSYNVMLIKLTAAGAIEWTRTVEVSREPQASKPENPTTLAIYLTGMLTDKAGNIYLAGRYVNPVTFPTADGTGITLTPHNTEGWDGDAQKSRGDFFMVRFNDQGYAEKTLTTTGVANVEAHPRLAWAGNDIILNFFAKGSGDEVNTITLAGNSIELPATSDHYAMINMRLDTDFNAQWCHTLMSSGVGGRTAFLHYNHVDVIGDNLWLSGMGNYTLTDGGDTLTATTTGNVREGYLIRCDVNTGNVLAATSSRTATPSLKGISGYIGVFEDEDNGAYVYGYSYAGTGIMLSAFNKETLAFGDYCSLITGGSQPSAQEMVAVDNRLYTLTRGRDQGISGQEMCPIGLDIAVTTKHWGILMAGFELPFTVKATQEETTLLGDVNLDGKVDAADIACVVSIITGTHPAGTYDTRDDVNTDGKVDSGDIAAIVSIITGE